MPARASLPRPTPRERSACQDTCVSQQTLRAGAQHSGRREPLVRRRHTTQIHADWVPAYTTTFVHAGARTLTIDLLFGVTAHTTTIVHAGAWTATNDLLSSAVHTEDTCSDLRRAKYRSDKYVRDLHTYFHTFRAGEQVSGRRDLPHSDAYGRYDVLTDALVAHNEVHTTTTWCRAPTSERCRFKKKKHAGACNVRCNFKNAGAY